MKNKYNIGDNIRAKIHYQNDKRKEVEATILSVKLETDNVLYKINFKPEEEDKKQGCTRCESWIDQDDIIELKNNMKTIEERRKSARNTNELLDHLVRLIEQNDDRFSFEFLVGGEKAVMEIYDKKKDIGYAVKIEPIEYDEDGKAINL